MPPKNDAPKVTNRYYQRTAGTARPCFICFRESTTVLATLNTVDFVYVCPGHLSDRGFATLLTPPAPATPPSTGPSKEEIAKVIADYEKKKGSKGKDKDKDGDDKKKKDDDSAAYLTPSAPAAPPTPTHNVYELHRDYWTLRQSEMRKRENLVKAKAVSKEMPKVPAGFGLVRPRPGPDGGGIL